MDLKKILGQFIALDGPDGCGKTTQVKLLVDCLAKQGVDVVSFREPGATAIGEKIRQILLNPEHIAMTTAAEVMLYMAARVQLWNEKISPALKADKCVVADRWLSSTCAYQGFAGGLGIKKVIDIAEHSLERSWPDLTIIIDVDLQTAKKRIKRSFDRMERKTAAYHKKVRSGFLKLAGLRDDVIVLDAQADIKTVHKKIIQIIEKHFSS